MRKVFLPALTLVVLCVGISARAYGESIYTLNQSTAFGNVSAGTVDVKQNGTDNVLVTVALGPGFGFSPTGLSLAFELSGVSNVTASSITGRSFVYGGLGSYNTQYGTWNYGVFSNLPSALCAKAGCVTLGSSLSFDLTAAGLTTSSFVANGGYYFAANLVDNTDGENPGIVVAGAGVQTGVTPEPSSLALLGTGALGIAGALRRRLLA